MSMSISHSLLRRRPREIAEGDGGLRAPADLHHVDAQLPRLEAAADERGIYLDILDESLPRAAHGDVGGGLRDGAHEDGLGARNERPVHAVKEHGGIAREHLARELFEGDLEAQFGKIHPPRNFLRPRLAAIPLQRPYNLVAEHRLVGDGIRVDAGEEQSALGGKVEGEDVLCGQKPLQRLYASFSVFCNLCHERSMPPRSLFYAPALSRRSGRREE